VVPGAFERAVSARLSGLGVDALIVAATHTHAGPGGYWDSLPGELGGTGPYDAATFERLADAIAGAVRDALADRGPATLSVARGRFPELARNRGGGSVDGRVLSLRVARPGGAPVAELVSFAAHATMLGGKNRLVSGDWPARLLAAGRGGTRLFFQGAVGDQSTHLLPGSEGEDPLDAYAGALDGYLARLDAGPPDPAPRLGVASATVALPRMSPGALPRFLRPAAATLLGGTFPTAARVTAVRAGEVLLVFTPAEPVEAVGRSWREAAGPGAEVISLASDYVGYVETAERFREGAGEAKRAYFGPQLATRLEAGVVAAARAADGAAPP
jgi:hypothetical protein